MPIYEYKCEKCGRYYEIIKNINDKSPEKCCVCLGTLRKVVSRPTLLKNAGIYLFDRKTGKDIIHNN